MTDYAKSGVSSNVRASDDAAHPTLNPFRFDLAASYSPATFTNASADRIQIGEVAAGDVLVPHLCRISIPQLDSNGVPTGDYSIGTADDPDALKGTAASETAVVLTGEDLLVQATPVGNRDLPTPIYLYALGAHATVAPTGVIAFDQVTRAYDVTVDG